MISPLLSVISINFNNYVGLYKTIESIKIQTCKNFEFIIIDGGSSDGSLELIKKNRDLISYYTSESDRGIYDAMNKGISAAKGKYLYFLNSGDWLINNNSIMDILLLIEEPTDLCFFGVKIGDRFRKIPENYSFTEQIISGNTPPHQGTIFNRDLFKRYGFYNRHFKIAGDVEFFARLTRRSNRFNCVYSQKILCEMEEGGIGSYESKRSLREKLLIHIVYIRNYGIIKKFYKKLKKID
jgi:glycosyltransferase involved in cell wall biosynthesis